MEYIVENTLPIDQTFRVKNLFGARVLSKKGKVVGRVTEVRINPKTTKIEGVVVRGKFFLRPIYIGATYFQQFSAEAIILTIEPTLLLKGKRVITPDGKILGKVRAIVRHENTNQMKSIVVRPLLGRSFTVPSSMIHHLGSSIILKPNANHGRTPHT